MKEKGFGKELFDELEEKIIILEKRFEELKKLVKEVIIWIRNPV